MAKARRIIVVHAGAGGDVSQRRRKYVSLVRQALMAMQFNTEEATEEAHLRRFTQISQILESSELTNTGYGSCVCEDGSVRCDSSVQHLSVVAGQVETEALGCVVCNSARYPMQDAVAVVGSRREKVSAHDGVVVPVVHVGRLERDDTLVSPHMQQLYDRLEKDTTLAQDTVGVFLYESWRDPTTEQTTKTLLTAGSSSGGNMLRTWTRVGSAGVVGSGCWVEVNDLTGDVVCALVSGQGEHIIRHDVARTVVREMLRSMETNRDSFLPVQCAVEVVRQRHMVDADLGIVGVTLSGGYDDDEASYAAAADLFYVHNTPTFVLGSLSTTGEVSTHVGTRLSGPGRLQQGQWALSL